MTFACVGSCAERRPFKNVKSTFLSGRSCNRIVCSGGRRMSWHGSQIDEDSLSWQLKFKNLQWCMLKAPISTKGGWREGGRCTPTLRTICFKWWSGRSYSWQLRVITRRRNYWKSRWQWSHFNTLWRSDKSRSYCEIPVITVFYSNLPCKSEWSNNVL